MPWMYGCGCRKHLRQNPGQVGDLKVSVADGQAGSSWCRSGQPDQHPGGGLADRDQPPRPGPPGDGLRQPGQPADRHGGQICRRRPPKGSTCRPDMPSDLSGEAEDMAESFGYMGESLLLAVVFVYPDPGGPVRIILRAAGHHALPAALDRRHGRDAENHRRHGQHHVA